MKGYRFYADYSSTAHRRRDTIGRRRQFVEAGATTPDPAANVIAVYLGDDGRELFNGKSYDCATGIFDTPNSPVATSGVSPEYLRTRGRRISEIEARRIHPAMFEYLAE